MYPDVIVEPLGADEWIARGREAASAGEILILELVQLDAENGERRQRLPVCVVDSHPIILDGHAAPLDPAAPRHAGARPRRRTGDARVMYRSDRPAVLTRELRARIIDISESGCLIEVHRRLDVGTVGTLELQLGAAEVRDDFEVVRCQAVDRARSIYHVGVRFLWTTPRHVGSIRHAVAFHAAELEPPDTTCVM